MAHLKTHMDPMGRGCIYLTWMVNLFYGKCKVLYVPVVWISYDNIVKNILHAYSCTIYIAGDGFVFKGRGRIDVTFREFLGKKEHNFKADEFLPEV